MMAVLCRRCLLCRLVIVMMRVRQQVSHCHGCSLGLLLFLMLLVLELGELLGNLWAVRTDLPMMTQFTPLAEGHLAHGAREGLLTRVRILVLFFVLGQAKGLGAEATLQVLLRVVLLVMTLQAKLGFESCGASEDVAFKDGSTF